MAKKQFIRHLEFYGFPDQNKYAGFGDIDLSDIHKKDKEQDDDLKKLSGTVETIISAQTEANKAISGIIDDIAEIEEFNIRTTETINDIEDAILELDDSIDDLSAFTNFNLAELRQGFNAYTRYADMEFAHRNNVYTKQEIDEKIPSGASGYATVEWVEEQGFLTEESGDTLYVRLDDFDVYSGEVESTITDLTEAIVAVDEKVDRNYNEFSAYTASATTIFARKTLENDVEELEGDVEDLKDNVASIKIDVLQNKVDIQKLSADTQALRDDVDEISGKVDTNIADIAQLKQDVLNRITRDEFDDTVRRIDRDIQELDTNKADKSDLIIISGKVNTLDAQLVQEINDRVAADAAQNANIANLNVRVTSAETLVRQYDERITSAESKVEQEIIDRKQADLDIIGKATDTQYDKTIYGVRKYADEIVSGLVESANTYTDSEIRKLDIKIDEISATVDTKWSEFATKEYVQSAITDAISGNTFLELLEQEKTDRINGDKALSGRCDELEDMYSGLSKDVSHAINQLGALTDWDGENPDDYEPWSEEHPDANGIIDRMHREIHDLKPEGIEELKAQVSANTADIAENTQNIATNAQNIADEATARETKDNELEEKVNGSIKNIEFANGILTITKNDNTSFTIDLTSAGNNW